MKIQTQRQHRQQRKTWRSLAETGRGCPSLDRCGDVFISLFGVLFPFFVLVIRNAVCVFLPRASGSKNSCSRMSKVKFDFSTVRTRVIPILRRVEVEDYPVKIGRVHGWSRQHVCCYLRKLEKCGLVKRKVRSQAVFYQLTGRGKTFLASCEDVVFGCGVYRLDRCQARFGIVAEGCLPVDFRRVEMANWTASLGLEQGVKVGHTSR
jgi:DNA-binding MarR family transcriptional regulator